MCCCAVRCRPLLPPHTHAAAAAAGSVLLWGDHGGCVMDLKTRKCTLVLPQLPDADIGTGYPYTSATCLLPLLPENGYKHELMLLGGVVGAWRLAREGHTYTYVCACVCAPADSLGITRSPRSLHPPSVAAAPSGIGPHAYI